MVLNAVNIVISIFFIIGVGMYLTWKNHLHDGNASLISHLVVRVALPFTIINTLYTSFTPESLRECLVGLVAPVASLALTMGIGFLLSRLLKLPAKRRGVFTVMFSFSNSVFIGVPVSTALFGESVMPYTLMYYIANTVLFWTIGVVLLRRDGGIKSNGDFHALPGWLLAKTRSFLTHEPVPAHAGAEAAWGMVKKALPLPLVTFFLCAALVLIGVPMPAFVLTTAKYIGNMVTPLSLFFIGIVVMRMLRKKSFRWEKGYLAIMLGRFVVSPVLMMLCARLFNLPELMSSVLLVQAGMPIMSQTPIVAGSMGSDEEYAAGGVALSTLLSLIAIPVYMAIL